MSGPGAELVRERQGAVEILRLNRPEARNALTSGLVADLGAAILEAESTPDIRAVVLTGTGERAFCAGMDLRSFAGGDVPGATPGETTDTYMRLLRGQVGVPVVGAANASAVAGGLELLLGCDVVIASSEARFGLPEVKRGLFAAGGGTQIGTRIPLAIALEMTLSGELVDAARAYDIGLVNAVVPPAEVLDRAVEMAGRIAANGPLGLAATKELVRLGVTDPSAVQSRLQEWSSVVFSSEDAQEGARAYVEKRDPSGGAAEVRAAVCRTYGPPAIVTVEELPPPVLDRGQVRVRVRSAAVNFPDVLVVADRYQISVATPFVPGSEFVGTVEEVAEGVQGVVVGDRVAGTGLVGAFAEEVTVAAGTVRSVPPGVDDRHAAAFGVAWRTAYHVLRSVARLGTGDELVVLGAGGGVGLAAVRLGRHFGATVTAVASSTAKLEAAAAQGAVNLVDHAVVDLRGALKELLPTGADVVVDPVGGDLAEPALRSLRWGGRFVTVGYASGVIPKIPLNLVLLKGCQVLGFEFLGFAEHAPDELVRNEDELWELFSTGQVVPHIGATFPLDETAAALGLVAEGKAIGKVVIDVSQ